MNESLTGKMRLWKLSTARSAREKTHRSVASLLTMLPKVMPLFTHKQSLAINNSVLTSESDRYITYQVSAVTKILENNQ